MNALNGYCNLLFGSNPPLDEFSVLQVGDRFCFYAVTDEGSKLLGTESPYTKVEEKCRPYTPEAYSNTQRGDGVFFYTTPTTKVVKVTGV